MTAVPADPAPPSPPGGAAPGPGGSADGGSAGRRGPSRRGYLVPGLIALAFLAALALVINWAGLSHPRPRTLSRSDAQTLLSQALQVQLGDASPPQVRCPGAEPVRAGWRFTCHLLHPCLLYTSDAADE